MEALRADEPVAPKRHFHELRQGFIPPPKQAIQKDLTGPQTKTYQIYIFLLQLTNVRSHP